MNDINGQLNFKSLVKSTKSKAFQRMTDIVMYAMRVHQYCCVYFAVSI